MIDVCSDAKEEQIDRHPVRWSLAIGLSIGGLWLLWAYLWVPVVYGAPVWQASNDLWLMVNPARFIGYGDYAQMYQMAPGFYAPPLWPLILAIPVRIADHYHMVQGVPLPVPRPGMWVLMSPFVAAIPAPLIAYGVRRLAWQMGIRKRLALLQTGLVILVMVPCFVWGHPEDATSLAFVLLSIVKARQERYTAAALLMGLSLSSKQWSVLLIPIMLILLYPPGKRLRSFLLMGVVPLVLVFPSLYNTPIITIKALSTAVSVKIPHGSGMTNFLMYHNGLPVIADRGIAVVLAVLFSALAFKAPRQIWWLMGAVLLLRVLCEPVIFAYYLAPPMCMFFIANMQRVGKVRIRDLFVFLSLMIWAQHPDRHLFWWQIEAAIAVPGIFLIAWPYPWIRKRSAGHEIDSPGASDTLSQKAAISSNQP